jgi:hypothetical protein
LPRGALAQRIFEVKNMTNTIYTGVTRFRDPEDRFVAPGDGHATREKMMDKTLADSFPASDPPSSLPDPQEDSFNEHALIRSG